ncbi:MAG: GIY-YIG nuclease family protein [Eubacteriales bacterium]|nr:GIY-YIG nuclease family protein [Eubacteriales bacterium]
MYYVYILTNKTNNVLYTGVTNSLERRLWEHRNNTATGFAEKYKAHKLVYYDITPDIKSAISREKEIKGWRREKKCNLINTMNPTWKDLSNDW